MIEGSRDMTLAPTGDMPLSPKYTLFIEAYCMGRNATQAAIAAGYSPKTAHVQGSRMLTNIIISTLPIAFVGYFLTTTLEGNRILNSLYTPSALIFSTFFFPIILFISDKTKSDSTLTTEKEFDNLSFMHAFFIGFFQIFALIPGASRAGVCISAARFLGHNRISATKYSMYLSVPTIFGAVIVVNTNLVDWSFSFTWLEAFFGFILSFVFAFFTIDFFLKILKKMSLTVFVIYRIFLAILMFVYMF